MSSKVRLAAVVVVCTLAAACQDGPPSLGADIDFAPAADLVDGTTTGNPFFFFLPPLTANPKASGVFDPSFEVQVEICELTSGGCDPVTSIVPVVEDDHYHADWKTSRGDAGKTFRVSVPPLGSIDVDLYRGRKPRNSDNALAQAGSTIPVKFIIEEGAFGQTCEGDCVQVAVPEDGGSLQITTGDPGDEEIVAAATFPDGWSPDEVTRGVTVDCNAVPVGDPGTGPLHTDLDQWPLFCQFSLFPPLADGETFDEDVLVAICNVDDDVQDQFHPPDAVRPELRLGKQDDDDVAGETFEILDPLPLVDVSASLGGGCEGVITQTAFMGDAEVRGTGPGGVLAAGMDAVRNAAGAITTRLSPQPLHAAMFRDGGVGALVSSFSLVGTVHPASISGTVTTAAGAGIAGATVTLSGPEAATTTTGAGGAYFFGDLDAGFGGGSTYTASVSGLPAGEVLSDPDQDVLVDGTGSFTADFSTDLPADIFFNAATGNFYEAIDTRLSWPDAKTAAEALTFGACVGHLATIASLAENDFITTNMPEVAQKHPASSLGGGYWIGGFQPTGSAEPAGGWSWVTGEPFSFTHWAGAEPNNSGGAEDSMQFLGDWGAGADKKKWNDEPGGRLYGYVVEYECSP